MIHPRSSTASQRAHWVSELIAHEASYGVVSQMSHHYQVSRQTLYSWKAKGQRALEASKPQDEVDPELERAVLTLLVEGHASYRGIQTCLAVLLDRRVSLGTITAIVQSAGERAQAWLEKQVSGKERVLALDEQYNSKRGEAYQSAGRCPQFAGVGELASCWRGWGKLDPSVMVSARTGGGLSGNGE